MGRDDARPIAGLQGGTAPARAFADFMTVAVANRPVEQFETEVPLPDWQLEPDEEAWAVGNEVDVEPLVDANGNPFPASPSTRCRARPAAAGSRPQARCSRRPGSSTSNGSTRCSRRGNASRNRSVRRAPQPQVVRPPQPTSAAAGRPASASAPTRRSNKPRRVRVAVEQLRFQRLELRAMIHVDAVRDLMRDDAPAQPRGGARISRQL